MRILATLTVLGALASAARAEEVAAPAAEKPWEVNVSAEDKARVDALFSEGGSYFGRQEPEAALARYQQALAIWDHPLIAFNAAVILIRLDRPAEAKVLLDRSLRYGNAPFTPEMYAAALDYKKLLDAHLASSTLKASVTDVPVQQVVTEQYRWPRWMPYTVMLGGLAIAAGGVGFMINAESKMNEYDQRVAQECVTGCDFNSPDLRELDELRDSATFRQQLGSGLLVAGGATVIVGIVLAVMNKPQRYVHVVPTAGGATATASWRF